MTQIKSRIKQGDEVIVIAGKDKGKRGTVRQVKRFKAGATRVLIDGVNRVKKHVRPNPRAGQAGGILDQESFIDISNVKIFNTETHKPDHVVYRFLKDGRKARCYKLTGEVIDTHKD